MTVFEGLNLGVCRSVIDEIVLLLYGSYMCYMLLLYRS